MAKTFGISTVVYNPLAGGLPAIDVVEDLLHGCIALPGVPVAEITRASSSSAATE